MTHISNIDRTAIPAFGKVNTISLPEPKHSQLSNGIDLYQFANQHDGLIRLDLVFEAGALQSNQPLIASTTANNLLEGTNRYTSAQIADMIDYEGSYISTDVQTDGVSITIYALNKNLEKTLATLFEVINEAVFPEKELNTYLNIHKQRYLVNVERVEYLAAVHFDELIFGKNHPNGRKLQLADYDRVQRAQIQTFHHAHYHGGNCTAFVAGQVTDAEIRMIDHYVGNPQWTKQHTVENHGYVIQSSGGTQQYVRKEGALQTAIRIGLPLFSRTHPDFNKMMVVNTILGGYFGSRLMANIREDKGYTYGIYSSLKSQKEMGYMCISTEVGADVAQAALKEIYHEITRLKAETVSTDELELVKNYMMGSLLRSLDGVFSRVDRYKNLWKYGLTNSSYQTYFNSIQSITPQEVQHLANQYYDNNHFIELLVGK